MKSQPSVAVTIRSFDLAGPAMDVLKQHCTLPYVNTGGARLTGKDLTDAVGGAAGVIAGTEKFSRAILDGCPDLRVISRVGVGTDSIDLLAAKERGIVVATTPSAVVQPVAEHTLALLLSALRHIPCYNEQVRAGDQSVVPGTLLAGKTAGIVGMGRIGTRVAGLLSCFGCRILWYDPMIRQVPGVGERAGSLEELVAASAIVSVHAAPKPDGSPLVDAGVLAHARGITLVNTARGSLIDEQALIAALADGRVAAAGLDVFPVEPYSGQLLAFRQVVATPHVASNTAESRRQMEMESVNNLIQALKESGL